MLAIKLKMFSVFLPMENVDLCQIIWFIYYLLNIKSLNLKTTPKFYKSMHTSLSYLLPAY